MNDILKMVISGILSVVIPAAAKQFFPAPKEETSLPWLRWCICGFIGGALGGLASGLVGFANVGGPGGVGNWAVLGASIGLLQWFALRGYREVGTWFPLASLAGWAFFPLGGNLGWFVAGLAVGLLQYLSLSRSRGSFWWIPANTIIWFFAGWAGIFFGMPVVAINPPLGWIFGWGIVGLVGAILLIIPLALMKRD